MAAKELVEYVAKSLVDDPDAVTVEVVHEDGTTIVSGASEPSRCSTEPAAKRFSGSSVRTSTRIAPRRPWTPRTSATTSR